MTELTNLTDTAFSRDSARNDMLVLVDLADCEIGKATKMGAHTQGLLHRAFSVVLWRNGANGPEFLISRRAPGKYHSAGLWANSCCSHPRTGEDLVDAAQRRVQEELGCTIENPRELGSFVYRAVYSNGITEYEYDHVFVAEYTGEVMPNPAESDAVRWVGADALYTEICEHPEHFSAWAPGVFSIVMRTMDV